MSKFFIDTDSESIPVEKLSALENALGACVKANAPLVIEFTCVSETEMQALNAKMRGVDKVTDVLSFPTLDGVKGKAIDKRDFLYDTDEDGRIVIGSVVICEKRAQEQAEAYGHSYERELHYLLVHGIMHCLGYDHETDGDKAEMRGQEELVLSKLGIVRV